MARGNLIKNSFEKRQPTGSRIGASVFAATLLLSVGGTWKGRLVAQTQLQSHTAAVVDLGTISASRLEQTLGVGIAPSGYRQDWQFATAKAMGASWVRIQCSWQTVEQQSDAPRNTPASPRYVQDPACVAALTSAAKYGLHVTETAAFGPPYHLLLFATLPQGANAGQTSLQISSVLGVNGATTSNLHPLYDYICPVFLDDSGSAGKTYRCQGGIGSHGGPPGTLITAVQPNDATHATLALASAVSKKLPANVSSPRSCTLQARSNALTCADGSFDASWVGVQIAVPGAGTRGPLTTVVTAVPSAHQLTLRLSAAKTVADTAVLANRLYAIGEILYPSTGTDRVNDASVNAYADYATFLANDMASRGISGDIEIWNEPPWKSDSWDFRPNLFDSSNSGPYKANVRYPKGAAASAAGRQYVSLVDGNQGNDPVHSAQFWSSDVPSNIFPGDPISGANFGFAANLQHRHFPAGVTATWNGTSGNGISSLLGPQMQLYSGEALIEPPTVVTRESFHPYGGSFNNPEDTLMRPDCLRSAARVSGNIFKNGQDCYLPGERGGANIMQAVEYDLIAKLQSQADGLGHSITETNGGVPGPGLQVAQARSNLRQFLGFTSLGFSPFEIFQLWDGAHRDPTYSLIDYDGSKVKPLPSYTALSGFMADLRPLGSTARTLQAGSQLSVVSYSGTYPLTLVHILGSRSNAGRSSDVLVLWQLSTAPEFTASATGNTLQVSAMNSGSEVLAPGELLEGSGVPQNTTITAVLTGSGGVGTYRVSEPFNVGTEALHVDWTTLPPPPPGTTSLHIPEGLHITGAIDLVTRKAVPYRISGAGLVIAVQDNPIALTADPL